MKQLKSQLATEVHAEGWHWNSWAAEGYIGISIGITRVAAGFTWKGQVVSGIRFSAGRARIFAARIF